MSTTNNQKDVKRRRRGCLGWGLRVIGGFIALLVLLFLAAFTLEKITLAQLPEKYPPPGELIDVGEYTLHLYCTGDPSSKPVIVVSPGSGSSVAQWALIQPEVAKFVRICVYDRLGTGWSFGTPKGQTFQEEAEDVQSLLQNAGIEGPYILVGASYGGAVMQAYASLYPQEVAGMVMVDVVTPGIEGKYPEQFQENLKVSRQVISAFSTPGLFRMMQWFGVMPTTQAIYEKLPPDWREMEYAVGYNSRMGANQKAMLSTFDERNAQFMSAVPLPDVPMIVIVRDRADVIPGPPMDEETLRQVEQVWRQGQVELAAQVSDSTVIVAEGSGHSIQLENPEAVVDAIREIVEQVHEK
ncbi:MAG TPA: alpha/beta hydrolase [Anaerolineales bacterium]|nr:alpha/beta hydrolase [Anaerolineales bacterium]